MIAVDDRVEVRFGDEWVEATVIDIVDDQITVKPRLSRYPRTQRDISRENDTWRTLSSED